ncbi:MAG TPA: hypothetical protein ENI78_02065 [Euryarchaeota archaeon]|nr:hypothetical protein [Euryarchaeota archaeon]
MNSRADRKAQAALEYIIVVGVMLLIVTSMLPVITKQAQLSKATAAIRDGATYGAGLRALGFKASKSNYVPDGAIKIKEIGMVNNGTNGNLKSYMSRIHIIAPDYIKDNSTYTHRVGASVCTQALRQLYYAFNGRYPGGGKIDSVNTSYYYFTCEYTFN